jgi:L-2-hydroxyglutarate oxidase LhgO
MIVVIGGGVVGLAVAAELAETDDVVLLERNRSYGLETSSHNSGVVHAGIYYPTGSLKHRLCIEGNGLLYAWAAERNVAVNRCGKLIIGVDETESEALEGVYAQAMANGVKGVSRIGGAEARALEPTVVCTDALYSETSGVIDQVGLMRSYAAAATERGAMLALQHEVIAIDRAGDGFVLQVRDHEGGESELPCDLLVNSAGLAADRVAAMLGYPLEGGDGVPRLAQGVNKGRYYDIVNREKARQIKHLVYPVPEHKAGGLGVHLTLDIDGGLHLGPDTEWLGEDAALDYRSDDTRREGFLKAAQRFLPGLESDDLAPGQVGYRPKLQRPGEDQHDFLIWLDRGYLHLGGIESPGMTSSLAIARHVRSLLT